MIPAPPLTAFGAVWFCYFAAIGLFNPYAPLWFKDIGFSTLSIGAIASLQSWTRVISPYGWGWLGDHTGRRAMLVQVGAGLAGAAAIGLFFSRGYTAVAVWTAVLFLANGAVVPLCEAALANALRTDTGMDTRRYGRVRMWGSIGFVTMVVIAGAVLQWAGIGWFPTLVVVLFGLLFVAALRLPRVRDNVASHPGAKGIAAVMRQPAVVWFFLAVFFTVLAHCSLYAFFSLYLDSLGYPKSAVGALWAVSIVVEIVFFWFQGTLFERFPPQRWLVWGAALAAVRFALIAAFGASVTVLIVAQLLHVVTFAAQHAACIMFINKHFGGALRGRGQALYTTLGYGISGVLGGFGGGWLSERFGFASVFWAAVLAACIGWFCALRCSRHERQAAP